MELDALKHAQNTLFHLKQQKGWAAKLARGLGICPQAVSLWRQVPPLRVIEVERLSGVPREELRPDLYPVERI